MRYPDFKLEDGIERMLAYNTINNERLFPMILDMAKRIKLLEAELEKRNK